MPSCAPRLSTLLVASRLASLALVVTLLAGPVRAHAQPLARHRLSVSAGGALALRRNDDRDDFGAHGAIDYELMLGRRVGLAFELDAGLFPYDREVFAGKGYAAYTALGFGPRMHLLASHRVDLSLRPALAAVLTGDLFRLGMSAEIGLDFAVSDSVALGPRLRYLHVLQPNGQLRGDADGRVVTLDFGVVFGRGAYARAEESAEPIVATVPELPEAPPTPPVVEEPPPPIVEEPPPLMEEPPPEPPPAQETPVVLEETPAVEARLNFTAGSAMLRDSAVRELRRVREALLADPTIVRVRVIGHADEVGGLGYTEQLSALRASTAVEWLVEHGIDRSRFELVGVGAREPIIPGRTEAARRANRRVQITCYRAAR